jgi:hypothetical protein
MPDRLFLAEQGILQTSILLKRLTYPGDASMSEDSEEPAKSRCSPAHLARHIDSQGRR